MNQEFDSMDCFALIMVGLPHMNGKLEKPMHEALKQRIVVHYNFNGLSFNISDLNRLTVRPLSSQYV
jgi:type II secretory pathway predicted ATPase ExeA